MTSRSVLAAAILCTASACVGDAPTGTVTPHRSGSGTQAAAKASSCVAAMHVSPKAGAQSVGDGSKKSPFANLEAAIAAAGKLPCEVTLMLDHGTYDLGAKPLVIAAPISIEGHGRPLIEGTIVVRTKGKVSFTHVSLSAPKQKDVPALFVDGSKDPQTGEITAADLTLFDVSFLRTLGFGLYLSGGTVTAFDLTFEDIGAAFNPASGTAIYVSNGAHATLRNIRMRRNAHALLATGPGTTVVAEHIVVWGSSGIHPAYASRIVHDCSGISGLNLGAVEFTDHARGVGSDWHITNSGIIGVYTHHNGDLGVTGLEVDSTYSVGPGDGVLCGGFGIGAMYGGALDVDGFTVSNSEVCGAVVANRDDLDPALAALTALDMHHGNVKVAPVGACVMVAGYDTERLHDDVRYIDVGVPLQALSYELPDAIP